MVNQAGFKYVLLSSLFAVSINAAAYYDEKEEERCREPKVQEFNLPEYSDTQAKEVPPEAEFSFVVSGWADPKKIKVMGKDKPIPFTVESRETYHRVKGKLPAEYNGKYVRLNVWVPAILGCYATQGWLLKVAGAATTAPAPGAASTQAPADAKAASAKLGESAPSKPVEAPVTKTVEGAAAAATNPVAPAAQTAPTEATTPAKDAAAGESGKPAESAVSSQTEPAK